MRNLLSLFLLLILFNQIGHADTEEYSVSVGYSADFCDDADDAICITNFDILTNGLFKNWDDGIPYGYLNDENLKTIEGLQYLYCAAISEHINEYTKSPFFYDQGMTLIDDYAKKHALRDLDSYKDVRHLNYATMNIPNFHQSWLVNNKDSLKGIIFFSISKVFDNVDVITDGDTHRVKIKKKMKESYIENCVPLI